MNILLWVFQTILVFFCVSGSVWRFFNYEQASKDVPSMAALPFGMWTAIGVFEIMCAVLLILPRTLNWRTELTGYAAAALAVEMLLVSGLHLKHFGFAFGATNPATWTLGLFVLASVVAYGRIAHG